VSVDPVEGGCANNDVYESERPTEPAVDHSGDTPANRQTVESRILKPA